MPIQGPKDTQPELLTQVHRYWHVLLGWKWTSGGFLTLVVLAAAVYSFLLPSIYTAHGTIWIEDDPNILPFEDVQTLGTGGNLQSHVRLLQSRSLAADVIEKMKLFENPSFVGRPKKGQSLPDPADPVFRESLVQGFLANLHVFAGDRSRLVDVTFSNGDPRLAADILNALFDGFIEMIVSKRYAASEKANEFLNEQIAGLRARIEQKEQELNEYGSSKDILPLTAAETPSVSRISQTNKALTDATLDRVNKFSIYNQLKAAPLGEIPEAPAGSLIQRLREEYIKLNREYTSRLATIRPEFPAMQRLKSDLDAATEALRAETENLIRSAYNDYQNALDKEQSLRRLLNSQKDEAYKASSSSVVYNSLRIELENQKALLESLSKRQSETDVSSRLKGLEALNVWIVDKADLPLRPASPNRKKNMLMAFLFGLVGGVGIVIGLEYLNQTVKTSKDILDSISAPLLGAIPAFEAESQRRGPIAEFKRIASVLRVKGERKPDRSSHRNAEQEKQLRTPSGAKLEKLKNEAAAEKIELIAVKEPRSIQAESYRSIRTTLLVSSPPGRIKTILFTSPLAREGKSSTISNMAIILAESGKRVVVVDSDLRKPKQSIIFGLSTGDSPGLTRYLSSTIEPEEIIRATDISNLHLITSGPLPATPIELLSSKRMDDLVSYLKRNFDFVLLDTPPVLAVSDALAMAPMVDTIILVARAGQTPIQALKQSKQKLDVHRLKCLGVILNGIDLIEQDGYYAREYYSYSKPE